LECLVPGAFSLSDEAVEGRGLGEECRGGGDVWRGGGEMDRLALSGGDIVPWGDDGAELVGNVFVDACLPDGLAGVCFGDPKEESKASASAAGAPPNASSNDSTCDALLGPTWLSGADVPKTSSKENGFFSAAVPCGGKTGVGATGADAACGADELPLCWLKKMLSNPALGFAAEAGEMVDVAVLLPFVRGCAADELAATKSKLSSKAESNVNCEN